MLLAPEGDVAKVLTVLLKPYKIYFVGVGRIFCLLDNLEKQIKISKESN